MKIIFIRHGKTDGNLEKRYIGRTDESLSETGREEILGSGLCDIEVDAVFVSPMKRCIETSELVFANHNKIIIDEWKEIDFGLFEGKNYQELKDDKDYQAWIDSNGTIAFPEGESREEFIKRCMLGFEKCKSICRDSMFETIACVVHGGTIMAIASTLTGKEYFDFQIDNAGKLELQAEL